MSTRSSALEPSATTRADDLSASAPRNGAKVGKVVTNGLLLLVALTYIYPFVWMAYTSLKTRQEFALDIFSLPSSIYLEHYRTIVDMENVLSTFFNSFFNSSISMVFVIVLAFLAGYALSRFSFPGRNLLYAFFLLGLTIPVHALLIPLFIQFRALKLLNTRITLLFPYITFHLPVAIYLFSSYINTIPRELEEAAYIDGSTVNYTLFHVVLPICFPITATVLILVFLQIWNEFPFALILLTGSEFRTVPVWLTLFQGQYTVNYPLQLTGMFLASFPVVALFLAFRERVIRGMAAGAIKG
jgi:raffinose/stachyose/melibiose transport system permease protein